MSLDGKNVLDIPKGCHKVPVGGQTYIYYHLGSHKNDKGQNINERVAVGKLDPNSGKLVPNEKFFYYFPEKRNADEPTLVLKCGAHAVMKKIVADLSLDEILQNSFGDRSDRILSLAQYMVREGNVMYYYDDYLSENLSFSPDVLKSAEISRLFETIDEVKKRDFFSRWLKQQRKQKECLAYDVTSFSSYSKKMSEFEYGYNRDKESLPQINYGMFVGQETRIPLYYRAYPGSIVDKKHLTYISEDLKYIGIKKAYYLMDRGFFSDENLKYMTEQGIRFEIAVPTSLNFIEELIDKHKKEIVKKTACKLQDMLIYGKKFEVNKYGFRMNVHLYYDPEKEPNDEAAFYKNLDRMEDDLTSMNTMPGQNSNYCKFFNITQNKDHVEFERNTDNIEKALERCGFFAIAETMFTKDTKEVLELYRDRDLIEKCFDDIKNELDLKRLHCSNEKVLEGKMFTAFIAEIILSKIHLLLSKYLSANNMTIEKAMNELDKIKVMAVPDKKRKYRLLNPLTKKQREILEAMGMDESIFRNM